MSAIDPHDFGTHLLRTRIAPSPGGGHWWHRSRGQRAETPFSPHPTIDLNPSPSPRGRIVFGAGIADERWYHCAGEASLASVLLDSPAPDAAAVDALRCTGAVLRSLHDSPVGDTSRAGLSLRPRPHVRLLQWFDDRATTPLGARLRRNAAAEIGEPTLARLRSGLAALPDPGDLRVTHGAPGLGNVVLRPSGGVELLTGEDLALAGRDHDINWVVGELTELSWLSGAAAEWSAAIDAFLDGYGDGDKWVSNELIACRLLLHVHDYVSFVRWEENAQESYLRFIAHVAGAAT